MTLVGGLLGYLGKDVDPAHVADALRRAPWRGDVSGVVHEPFGAAFAFGAAKAGVHRHVGIVLHGRIDNLADLAGSLNTEPGNVCAVLAEAYLRYGGQFGEQVVGDFAVLVLDERRHSVLAVRDWAGARPLFWGTHHGVVAFGSEVKQVLALLGRPYALDEETVAAYIRMRDQPVTATFARGVQAVAPSGQILATLDSTPRSSMRAIRFRPNKLSLAETVELLQTRMDTAVLRRVAGAARPSALISGGMDSTSAAATAASLAARGLARPLVAGVSLHLPDVPASDELAYSRTVVDHWSIPWYPVTIAPHDLSADPTELLALHDGPVYPGIQMFDRMYAEAARRGADMLLTGQGGDIWQDQYFDELLFCLIRQEWRAAARWLAHGARTRPKSTVKRLALAAHAFLTRTPVENNRYVETGTRYWTIRMAYETEERLGQYHGLQVEFPFLDRELAEALVGISPALRSNPQMSKLPMRAAMADRLPEVIRARADKAVFDPLLRAAYGEPRAGQSTARMVAERYTERWRWALSPSGLLEASAAPSMRPIDPAKEYGTIVMGLMRVRQTRELSKEEAR